MAEAYDYKRDSLWVRFPLYERKYLIFSFGHSSNETKRGNEIRHSKCNASRIRRNVGNGIFLTIGSLGISCYVHYVL